MIYPKSLFLLALLCDLSAQEDWLLVGEERSVAISGIARVGGQTIVVHDNKREYEGRIGIVTESGEGLKYRILEWPDETLPFDVEALTAIPGSVTDMIAMESQGKCHWLVFDQAKMRLAYNGFIQIPKIKWPTNLEGFGLMKVGDKFLAAWGHRGKSKYPGKLFWGWLVFNSRTVEAVDSIEISVEWPTEHVRHIADLKINEFGDCWIVATSDPGDDGPFSSALYHIGRFQIEDNQINFYQILSRKPAFKFETHKVEGFDFIDNGIITATDDENFGGSIKTVYFK
ncbi:MAG: hypothetical protein CMF79_07530 [Candidatus Marinimicrobia bacterium]|jgi:hypothetical protein|nr:hypothetical protein [Candidatus Neomarinimicrobiota bacterium]|tara:strand:+ start:31594 stop:32448 length:855 start_codon:yes stop_codon:yes gene_type:complete